jgi:hypothetical protein
MQEQNSDAIWMEEKHNSRDQNKADKEAKYENLLVIVVLVFSFIYFLFQLYSWIMSPPG